MLRGFLGSKKYEPCQPTKYDHTHLHQWRGSGENGACRSNGQGSAPGVGTQIASHTPDRLRDNRDGNDFKAVKDARVNHILIGDDTITECNQGKCRRHRETEPGGERAQQPASGQSNANADLTRRWPGQKLAKRHQICIGAFLDPFSTPDKLVAEITKMRDWPTK